MFNFNGQIYDEAAVSGGLALRSDAAVAVLELQVEEYQVILIVGERSLYEHQVFCGFGFVIGDAVFVYLYVVAEVKVDNDLIQNGIGFGIKI